MNVFEIDDLPYAEFGNEPKRKVRLVIQQGRMTQQLSM